jgi:UDP-N-acetylmuramate dehydrogenase
VLKVEVRACACVEERADAWIVEAGAGENWHETSSPGRSTGLPGLENLALIPGTVGASPVQNIGAYGVELKDRFESLDAVDLSPAAAFTLDAEQCAFGYRDSVFKHSLAGEERDHLGVRFRAAPAVAAGARLPGPAAQDAGDGIDPPDARQIFDWVCAIRRAKLPDPRVIGNAGSFFKNPVVTPEQCRDIIGRDPEIVHYPMPDGSVKLAAGWLIDACGWKGKSVGQAGVYEKQALVLVNPRRRHRLRGDDAGAGDPGKRLRRFGIRLEPEPVVV